MSSNIFRIIGGIVISVLLISFCPSNNTRDETKPETRSGYSDVNGIRMYYEIHGSGKPLVLIHGGGSTIETSFKYLIPVLEKQRQLICVEMQAHGHTGDRNANLSFEQDADDIATLLKNLNITKADFLGFSNGGQTLIEIGLRHPEIADRFIIAGSFYKRSAAPAEFWNGIEHATLDDMPLALRQGQLKANGNNQQALLNSFKKDVERMKAFKGWTDEQIASITVRTLIISGTRDVGSLEHSVEMYRTMPGSELAVFPGIHGSYFGSAESDGLPEFNAIALINQFLAQK